ncbi:hypothetical protein [Streptomyces malaysiensis]|uniref:Secreted protein n=1 Tax=Streptomyces malaysiensis subsp. samsunensis TaxID=459658 RepID=A0A9X2M6C9_STRMQ|nr:hypothetical protein [Streptomyces samsunensis]MCQ8836237.1 hypothetical protein [Streptomyces samsunensis]
MNSRLSIAAVSAVSLVALMGGTTVATAQESDPAPKSCDGVRLTGELPAPAPGQAVSGQITIGPDCEPELGSVRRGPASDRPARTAATAAATAAAGHQLRGWNEMYDCCNIRMTGLYTASSWDTADGRVTTAGTTATQEWNREPWDAGWSLTSRTAKDDCATDCAEVNSEAHADFAYQGVFDPIGDLYDNTHHSYVQLKADGTASCRFDVELRHTFVGWNWRYGCE